MKKYMLPLVLSIFTLQTIAMEQDLSNFDHLSLIPKEVLAEVASYFVIERINGCMSLSLENKTFNNPIQHIVNISCMSKKMYEGINDENTIGNVIAIAQRYTNLSTLEIAAILVCLPGVRKWLISHIGQTEEYKAYKYAYAIQDKVRKLIEKKYDISCFSQKEQTIQGLRLFMIKGFFCEVWLAMPFGSVPLNITIRDLATQGYKILETLGLGIKFIGKQQCISRINEYCISCIKSIFITKSNNENATLVDNNIYTLDIFLKKNSIPFEYVHAIKFIEKENILLLPPCSCDIYAYEVTSVGGVALPDSIECPEGQKYASYLRKIMDLLHQKEIEALSSKIEKIHIIDK